MESIDDFERYESETTLVEDSTKTLSEELVETRDHRRTDDWRIAKSRLDEIRRELCIVELCWPEIDVRKDDDRARRLPSSYRVVPGKERLLAFYAENFRLQFHARHPERRPLLFTGENECGVQKFVSTTIRRSTLPYSELYTWQGCGKFVSDYIEYEPLDKALSMPRRIRSPTWLAHYQKGNCFEVATFLTSLLLGQGYNAFVASGYASREQTLCDMTMKSCPYLQQPKKAEQPHASLHTNKYKLKPPPDLRSQFLLELEMNAEERMKEEARHQEAETLKMIRELERLPEDEYRGHRVHAWVVILPELKGPREAEILEPLFIEPSSGESFKPSDPETDQLYYGVESLWNDKNYWANVQPPVEGCATINWALGKTEDWEHLLPGEPWTTRGNVDEVDEEITVQQEKHLDMPSTYVNEIVVRDLDFEKRYPNGRKTVFYKKAKVQLYAPYMQADGMIEQITVYEDYDYATPIEIYEKYLHRSDNLTECKMNLIEDAVVDYYKRGRSDQVKEHRYFASDNDAVDRERILDFYHVARLDGLSRIEMHPSYMTQLYENRDDFLYYRHVQFSSERDGSVQYDIHSRHILKVVEKYHRDETIRASRNVAIREFAISENEVRLLFHYNHGQCSRGTRTYVKPALADRGDRLVLDPSMIQEYNPDPVNEPVKSLDVYYELEKQLKEEDGAISEVRAGEVEVSTFLKRRIGEYHSPVLFISAFDRHRNVLSELDVSAKVETMQEESLMEITGEIDYLKPYLARIGSRTEINEVQALVLKEECLNDYKQLLVRRANNILRKFEEYTEELERTQVLLTQSEELTREEEDKILEKTNEISFQLHALEVRLNRHKELVPERYRKLLCHLQQSPHLSALQRR